MGFYKDVQHDEINGAYNVRIRKAGLIGECNLSCA